MWRSRELSKANMIYADGRLIAADEDGHLALAPATPKGLELHAKVALLSSVAWTAPTLVGTTVYVRDRQEIMALNVGKVPVGPGR